MRVKEAMMDREREQQEMEEYMYMDLERERKEMEEYMHFATYEALKEAAKYLSSDKMDVLMYHCGFTNQDLIKE